MPKFGKSTDHDENLISCIVVMGTIASQITSLTIVYSTIYSDPDQRKLQSSASLAFVTRGTGEFPPQMASNTENVSIWWHHHAEGEQDASAISITNF